MSKNPKTSQSNINSTSMEKNDDNDFGLFSNEYREMNTENQISTNFRSKESSSNNTDYIADSTISINAINIINQNEPSNKKEDEKNEDKKKRKRKTKKKKIEKKVKKENIKKEDQKEEKKEDQKEEKKEDQKEEKEKEKEKEKKEKEKENENKQKEIEKENKQKEQQNENMEGKEIKEKENNWKENFLKKTQNITGNISDDIVINKITQDNNNGRNNKREAFEVELETTNNTSVFITINDISNYSNFPNDNIIHDYQLEILNKKHEIIIILILLKNSISNYTIFIVDRIKTKFGSKFQLINILAKIAFLINLEKENEENFSKIINILLILFMGNIKDLLLGPFSNLNYEEKEVAKKEIELICKIENNNKKMKCKVLNYLFHEKLEELFKKYLNDSFYIIIGKSNFCLKKIQTFKDNFNEYETEKKQNIKKCVYFSLGYELTNYEKSSIEENNIVQQIKINHYNSRRVIINEAIISFFSIIKKYSLDKYGIKIYKPTLKNKLKHNVKQYEKFFNNKLKFIFSYLMPRRISLISTRNIY